MFFLLCMELDGKEKLFSFIKSFIIKNLFFTLSTGLIEWQLGLENL